MRSRGAQLWNKMNILAGLSLLLSCGEQASYFKSDFSLVSPFERAAAAFLLLFGMLSELTISERLFFSFQLWKRAVGSNNTDVCMSVAFLFVKGKQQQTIRKKNPQMSPTEFLIPLDKHQHPPLNIIKGSVTHFVWFHRKCSVSGNNFEEKPPRRATCSDYSAPGSHAVCDHYTERIFKVFPFITVQNFKDSTWHSRTQIGVNQCYKNNNFYNQNYSVL